MAYNNNDDELNFLDGIENNRKNNFAFKNSNKQELELTKLDTGIKKTECATNKNILDLQPDFFNLENFDNFGKKKIFSIRKVRKLFKIKKIKNGGRPKKNEKKIIGPKQGKNRYINARIKIRNSTRDRIHYFIKKHCKGLEDLDSPIIEDKGENSNNKSIYQIYCDFVPKKYKGEKKIVTEDKKLKKKLRKKAYSKINKNKRILDKFIDWQIKEHNILFNFLKYKDFLKAYLKNEKRIVKYHKTYGPICINLIGFETYDDCFNWEYDQTQKETFKKHMLEILDKE